MNNRAQDGRIAFIDNGYIMFITHNKFSNNSALFGGVLSLKSFDAIKIVYNLFIHNNATTGHGGVINTAADSSVDNIRSAMVIIDSNEFTNNHAETNGGVLYINKHETLISDCKFTNNSACVNGGILWSQDSSNVEIIGRLRP